MRANGIKSKTQTCVHITIEISYSAKMPKQILKTRQQMVLGKLDVHMWQNKIRPVSITLHETDFKWLKDLNVKPETTRRNIGSTSVNSERSELHAKRPRRQGKACLP